MPTKEAARSKVRRPIALVIGLGLGLAAAEGALRVSGVYATYSERNYGEYHDVYGRFQGGRLCTWPPSSTRDFTTAEFRYRYAINADGVRDLTHEPNVEPGRKRIVVLGDSYAEGVGADRHEAWPAVLGELLARDGVAVEVLNAGVSGSDPCFEYQLLRERFLRYRPDLVILALNDSDICDVIAWGGSERFQEDGSTRGRPRPRGMAGYRHSHLVRWVLHTVFGLERATLTFGSPARVHWDAQQKLVEACADFAELRAEQPFEFLVVVHPVPNGEGLRPIWFYRAFFDRLAERDITALDLSEPLGDALTGLEYVDYAWSIDYHFKARGYAALAAVMAERLRGHPLLAPPPR